MVLGRVRLATDNPDSLVSTYLFFSFQQCVHISQFLVALDQQKLRSAQVSTTYCIKKPPKFLLHETKLF